MKVNEYLLIKHNKKKKIIKSFKINNEVNDSVNDYEGLCL